MGEDQRTQHTPGPWEFKNHGADHFFATNHQFGVASFHGHPRWIAQVEGMGPEAEANARLIKAAPKLLAALKQILESTDSDAIGKFESDAAYAAIAEVEGEAE